MARTVDQLDGLAAAGVATVGPVRFPVPGVAWARRPTDPVDLGRADQLRVTVGPDVPVGRRAVELSLGHDRVRLEYPVAAPEVSGAVGDAQPAADGIWVVHWPLPRELWEPMTVARPSMVVLGNARALLRDGEPFTRAIRELREHLGAGPVLWAPRVALPHRLAFLAYVGVDLVDTTEARWMLEDGGASEPTLGPVRPTPTGRVEGCSCPACRAGQPLGLGHVEGSFAEELGRVRAALTTGRLRELVEARLVAEPLLAEQLRFADRHLAALLEERTPVVSSATRPYVLRESLRRPEVRRFLARFLERYRPPAAKEVLLLLPCSKTKPYRSSPSHRRYLGALAGLEHLARLHIVSVTSPLGLVPRELEDVYPARHYDIPVTGEWDEEERRRVLTAAGHLGATGRYRQAILHLDPEEYGFLREVDLGTDVRWTAADDRPLAAGALDALRDAVGAALGSTAPVSGGALAVVREELREVAAYQFGRAGADGLFAEPVRLVGRPWFQRVQDADRTDLASWKETRGLFQLTVAGGRRLQAAGVLQVEVAPEVALTGDLFTPGVRAADPAIRAGDAVLLVQGDALVAVGEAELPGPLMTQLPHGRAVTVRHRVRPTPT
jgi:archaeosine synthase alpha-subunit